MEENIPVKIQKKSRRWVNLVLIFLIIMFAAADTAFIWFFAKTAQVVKKFSASAQSAADSSSRWSFLKTAADTGLAESDVAGEDIPVIGRSAGSIRTGFAKSDNSVKIGYETPDAPEQVLNFFKSQLAKNNWIVSEMAADKIIFTQNNQKITVSAAVGNSGITAYEIVLTTK